VRLTLNRKRKQSVATPCQQARFLPHSFVLCERASGAVRFRVDADSDGSLPVEKVAGLLAVHCLVRGQAPEDYEVMVITQESLLDPIAERAQQLLTAGRALGSGVKVSRREREVLDGVLQSLANKEIASRLNVSERTVKFHVSSLLAKFGVTDRVALSREAAMGITPTFHAFGPQQPQNLFGFPVRNSPVHSQDTTDPVARTSDDVPRDRTRAFPVFGRERYAT
jgi:DNA-binding CsgD family transcriptional regulator